MWNGGRRRNIPQYFQVAGMQNNKSDSLIPCHNLCNFSDLILGPLFRDNKYRYICNISLLQVRLHKQKPSNICPWLGGPPSPVKLGNHMKVLSWGSLIHTLPGNKQWVVQQVVVISQKGNFLCLPNVARDVSILVSGMFQGVRAIILFFQLHTFSVPKQKPHVARAPLIARRPFVARKMQRGNTSTPTSLTLYFSAHPGRVASLGKTGKPQRRGFPSQLMKIGIVLGWSYVEKGSLYYQPKRCT